MNVYARLSLFSLFISMALFAPIKKLKLRPLTLPDRIKNKGASPRSPQRISPVTTPKDEELDKWRGRLFPLLFTKNQATEFETYTINYLSEIRRTKPEYECIALQGLTQFVESNVKMDWQRLIQRSVHINPKACAIIINNPKINSYACFKGLETAAKCYAGNPRYEWIYAWAMEHDVMSLLRYWHKVHPYEVEQRQKSLARRLYAAVFYDEKKIVRYLIARGVTPEYDGDGLQECWMVLLCDSVQSRDTSDKIVIFIIDYLLHFDGFEPKDLLEKIKTWAPKGKRQDVILHLKGMVNADEKLQEVEKSPYSA